jgi:dihydrofolate reductase
MILSIIVALGENNEIGKDGKLLCHLPADLKRFKEITWGHTVIMGRKTFESLPQRPLPNRKNIVLSRNRDLEIEGATVRRTLNSALVYLLNENEVFIIGGAQIYDQILPIVDKIYLTKIHAVFPDADAFFPPLSTVNWKEIKRETFPADENNPYSYSFIELGH